MAKKNDNKDSTEAVDLGAEQEIDFAPEMVPAQAEVAPVQEEIKAPEPEAPPAQDEVEAPAAKDPLVDQNAAIAPVVQEDLAAKLERLEREKAELARVAEETAAAQKAEIEKAREEMARLAFEKESEAKRQREAAISAVKAIKALHDFKCVINGTLLEVKKDQVILDLVLIKFLLENEMPVAEVHENIDFYFCKHCHQKNDIDD